jgi:hypothetical protein
VQTYERLGVTALGSEAASIDSTSTVEATFNSREDEKVTGGARSSATGQCHPELSHESDPETPVGAG